MNWTAQQHGNWSRTSDNADSPWYDGGAQTALAAIPAETDSVDLAAQHVTADVAIVSAVSIENSGGGSLWADSGWGEISVVAELHATGDGSLVYGSDSLAMTGKLRIGPAACQSVSAVATMGAVAITAGDDGVAIELDAGASLLQAAISGAAGVGIVGDVRGSGFFGTATGVVGNCPSLALAGDVALVVVVDTSSDVMLLYNGGVPPTPDLGSGPWNDSLAALWRCLETGGGTVADSSGNGLDGTCVGGCTQSDSGITLDGIDGKVSFGAILRDLGTNGPFSISAWVEIPEVQNRALLSSDSTGAGGEAGFALLFQHGLDLEKSWYTDVYSPASEVPVGSLLHIVVVQNYDAEAGNPTTVDWYINGVFVGGSAPDTGSYSSTGEHSDFCLGYWSPNGASLSGTIRDVAIFSRALTTPLAAPVVLLDVSTISGANISLVGDVTIHTSDRSPGNCSVAVLGPGDSGLLQVAGDVDCDGPPLQFVAGEAGPPAGLRVIISGDCAGLDTANSYTTAVSLAVPPGNFLAVLGDLSGSIYNAGVLETGGGITLPTGGSFSNAAGGVWQHVGDVPQGITPGPGIDLKIPAPADVRRGVAYLGGAKTGGYNPVSGDYTDPGAANVRAGTSYRFAGQTETGVYRDLAAAAAVAGESAVPGSNAAASDIYGSAFNSGTATLLARISTPSGVPLAPGDVAGITYSIYLLDDDDADARRPVPGHANVSLPVAGTILAALQPWAVDGVGYNFCHVPDVSAHAAFPVAGRQYLVEHRLVPAAGPVIVVRFRINAI